MKRIALALLTTVALLGALSGNSKTAQARSRSPYTWRKPARIGPRVVIVYDLYYLVYDRVARRSQWLRYSSYWTAADRERVVNYLKRSRNRGRHYIMAVGRKQRRWR